MAKLFANSGDPDQTPHSVVSDLGRHCLPITLLRVSRLQLVKQPLIHPTQVGPTRNLIKIGPPASGEIVG